MPQALMHGACYPTIALPAVTGENFNLRMMSATASAQLGDRERALNGCKKVMTRELTSLRHLFARRYLIRFIRIRVTRRC
jgi:hypothetical protein